MFLWRVTKVIRANIISKHLFVQKCYFFFSFSDSFWRCDRMWCVNVACLCTYFCCWFLKHLYVVFGIFFRFYSLFSFVLVFRLYFVSAKYISVKGFLLIKLFLLWQMIKSSLDCSSFRFDCGCYCCWC